MKYAIIAAGEGSRLAKEGILSPKPLVKVKGEYLIDRLIRVFTQHGATEIVTICNEQMTDVHLRIYLLHLCIAQLLQTVLTLHLVKLAKSKSTLLSPCDANHIYWSAHQPEFRMLLASLNLDIGTNKPS